MFNIGAIVPVLTVSPSGVMLISGIKTFYEQVLSFQDSLRTASLIITVSRDKPCWLARYNYKG